MAMEEAKPKKLSAPLVIAIALIVVLAGALGFALFQLTAPRSAAVTYPIGLAIATTGTAYVSEGPIRRDAALLAIEHMNANLRAVGSPVTFSFVHEDTGGVASGADTVFRNFQAAGIKVVVGPLSSGETSQVRDFVTTNKIVAISPSSTSISLAQTGDYVFRAAPDDRQQVDALTKLVYTLGYRDIYVLARQDDYGQGLSALFEQQFETEYGGTVTTALYSTSAQDLSPEVTALNTAVGAASPTKAVLVVAFTTDGLEVFDEARTRSNLPAVRWFGSESLRRGIFLNQSATSAPIRTFLRAVNLTGFFPSPADNPVKAAFESAFSAKYGTNPANSPYAYYSYDSSWLAMMAVLQAGRYDGEAISKALPVVAERYFGASGYKKMNTNGDALGADFYAWYFDLNSGTGQNMWTSFAVWRFPSEDLEFL